MIIEEELELEYLENYVSEQLNKSHCKIEYINGQDAPILYDFVNHIFYVKKFYSNNEKDNILKDIIFYSRMDYIIKKNDRRFLSDIALILDDTKQSKNLSIKLVQNCLAFLKIVLFNYYDEEVVIKNKVLEKNVNEEILKISKELSLNEKKYVC